MHHGIRLDAYVEESRSDTLPAEFFDIEPDTKVREKRMLPKRSRYYHSRMDGKILESGRLYDTLPNTWVIFITSFDPFSKGRMVYTIKNHCIEVPEMEYNDGATTLFLNITGVPKDVSQDIKELLAYIQEHYSCETMGLATVYYMRETGASFLEAHKAVGSVIRPS